MHYPLRYAAKTRPTPSATLRDAGNRSPWSRKGPGEPAAILATRFRHRYIAPLHSRTTGTLTDLLTQLTAALVGTYRIERELGGGGMSRVFLAEELRLGRRVVIKVLPPEMSIDSFADRFEREIRVAASLQHPHLVPLLSAGVAGDVVYYVMPFIPGDSLAARISRDGALPIDDILRILHDVLEALAYAHGRGIVHRDIKPDNILLIGRHALVTDFGIAKAVSTALEALGGTALTSRGLALGTPAYMAPEQAAADPLVDQRADLYALGAVAYEMLAGRPPFNAPTAQAMLAAQMAILPDRVDRFRSSIPAELASLVMRALEKIPADRPQSADAMLAQLDLLRPLTPAPGSPTTRAGATISRTGRMVGLFAVATACLTALAFGLSRLAGLPDWVWIAALACMVVGLPVVLYTGRLERRRAEARVSGTYLAHDEGGHQRMFTWRRAVLGGAVALGTVMLLTGAYVVSGRLGIGPAATLLSAGRLAAQDRLVLADFLNRTADSSLGNAVTEALRVDLGQSRAIHLLDGRQVSGALRRMGARPDTALTEGLARELAIREGAKAIVAGEISRLGSGYVLTARIVTADSGATLAPVRVTADDEAALIPAVNALSADLRARIGESLRTIRATEPLEQVTTASLPALRLYTDGRRAFDAGDYGAARALLLRAVGTDTAFAMAWRRLGAVYYNLGSGPAAQIEASTRAFNHRDRLPPLERFLTEGYYYTSADQRDPEKAITAYRAALDNSPEDPTALNNLGMTLTRVGRFAAAESVLRQGMAFKPTMPLADNLVDALVSQSKWNALDSVFQVADSISTPDHPARIGIRLTVAFAERAYARAESLVAAHEGSGAAAPPSVSWGRVQLDVLHGRYGRAARLLREVRDIRLASGERLDAARAAIAPAGWLGEMGRSESARRELRAALSGPVFRQLDTAAIPVRELGRLHAVLGDVEGVRKDRRVFETQQPSISRVRADSLLWAGLALQAEHRWREAAAALSEATTIRYLQHCSPCGAFYAARMWDAAGVADSTVAYYRQGTDRPALSYNLEDATLYPVALRRLGELYEQRGDRTTALDWYSRFVDLWHDADPDLQPLVGEVRGRIARLTAEPKTP